MAAILVEHLSKAYPGGTQALADVNLDVADGEFVAIVGPSGCGKSTLLRILAGLDAPTDGAISFGSPSDVTVSLSKGAALPSAMVFQEAALFPWMRVEDNVALAFDSLPTAPADVRRRVAEQLDLVGLSRFARAYPHQLSGGMKQRVAVARAFAVDPPLLFMDEPFGALDEQTRVGLAGELMRLWERTAKTVVFVTHGIEEAITLADRVVVLSASPGTVRAIVPIDVPRPRDAVAIRGDAHFAELVVRIWDLLR